MSPPRREAGMRRAGLTFSNDGGLVEAKGASEKK
jgi:hypothetical protein